MPAYQHADTPALLQLVKYSDVYGGATERIDSMSKAWQSSKQVCHDAWAMPGYIWYGPSTRDVRWVLPSLCRRAPLTRFRQQMDPIQRHGQPRH